MKAAERSAADPDAVAAAADHLRNGGLLVHPTTGVYGIGGGPASDLDRELTRLKGRREGKGVVRLAADAAGLRRAFPDASWPPLAEVLAAALWPGPLTLVLDDGSERGIAVRAEAHPFTRAVLRAYGAPLGSTSLNAAGEEPAADPPAARRVLAAFPESRIPVLFVDAGRLSGPPPSTLVRVPGRDGRYDLLREGRVRREEIERIASGDVAAGRGATDEEPT